MLFQRTKPVITDEKRIDELLSRGVHEVIPSADSLKKLLMSGKRLRIKLGIDPTSPNVHLGRTVPLLKLRDFQELGHQVVFIVGDFTALIGDTSDKDSERPMLGQETVLRNMRTYRKQVGKILNLSQTEFVQNSSWLSKLSYEDICEHANLFSVADFIARDNIKKRLDEGRRVSLRETLYPIMQGYDSVAVRADVELGGSDQRFNVLSGRPLQEHFGQPPQHCLLFSLVVDPSGKKMSSSWGNTINIEDAPQDMFGKTMAIPDTLIEGYAISMTRLPLETVASLRDMHPKEAKTLLAKELVRMYHGDRAAEAASTDFEKTFSQKEAPTEAPECVITENENLLDGLVKCGVVSSKTEGRRLFEAGAVRTVPDDTKITDSHEQVPDGVVLRVGKHRFIKIVRQ